MMKKFFIGAQVLIQLICSVALSYQISGNRNNEQNSLPYAENSGVCLKEEENWDFSFLFDNCLLETEIEPRYIEEHKEAAVTFWDYVKQWILENPKKAITAGIITTWSLKSWFTNRGNPLAKNENHNKLLYSKWPDNQKDNWRTLIDLPTFVTTSRASSSMEIMDNSYAWNRITDATESNVLHTTSLPSTDINLNYQYDDTDINTLLILRAQEDNLDLDSTIIMAPLHNDYYQIFTQLLAERSRNIFARNILIPLNLINKDHWVSLVIRLDHSNKLVEIVYIDSLGGDIPKSVIAALQSIYGAELQVTNRKGLLQMDDTSCGPLVVENLLLEAQHRLTEQQLDLAAICEIRSHHLSLIKRCSINLQLDNKQLYEQKTKKRITHSINLDIDKQYPQEKKEKLARTLYPILETLVPGISFIKFKDMLFPNKAKKIKALLYLNGEKEYVGFSVLRYYELNLKGKKYIIVNPLAAIMEGYRGGTRTFSWSFCEIFKLLLTHPWENIILSGFFTPYSYHMCAKHMQIVYPSYKQLTTPPEVEQLAKLIAEQFEYKIDSTNQFLVDISENPYKITEEDRNKWRNRKEPDISYYVDMTGLNSEKTLLTIIPITFNNMITSGITFILNKISRGT